MLGLTPKSPSFLVKLSFTFKIDVEEEDNQMYLNSEASHTYHSDLMNGEVRSKAKFHML